ncbi:MULTISPECIES: DNA recombination protein RmuC [unclassified Variovorax]|uniref:DNA recombination protein RmuC n=1 Tax=unclassified Variovorax TaxID=663243 RepID=UPI000A00C7BF|nr:MULTISPECIES: DNA recombination protein RmuC [unclassified Variovorax]
MAAAVSKAEAAAQGDLAQLRERVRTGEEAHAQAQSAFEALKRDAGALQDEVENANQEAATFRERASQIPRLTGERDDLAAQLRTSEEEARRLSNEVSEQGASLKLLKERVPELVERSTDLERRLNTETEAVSVGNQRIATLEEQASRLPGLQRQLDDALQHQETTNAQLTELKESSGRDISRLSAEVKGEREAHGLVRDQLSLERTARGAADAEVARLAGELTDLKARAEGEREAAAEKLQMLVEARQSLSDQFKALANDILEEKSKRFSEQNQESLGQLLAPLKNQLTEFKGKVEEVYVQEGKDRSALQEQVKLLMGLNQVLSDDAKNLTQALKGSAKTQGNWGELVLERVLEASGLRKGHEYIVQDSQQREDGSRAQPDVVIHLPEERRLVVDAKVSLLAYEQHISADTDEDRALSVKRHLDSVRTHIKGLSDKKYQALYGLQSLDFVLMFVPVEPAFMMAVTHDSNLFMEAWDRNVLLVSPSTLLFVVRTVAHLWRQEAQSKNAQDIAKRGAELYERLHDFVKDLDTVGNRLNQAREAYDSAHKRLTTGRGNVIRQAEMLRDLGVKPTKALAPALVEAALADEIPSGEALVLELGAGSSGAAAGQSLGGTA